MKDLQIPETGILFATKALFYTTHKLMEIIIIFNKINNLPVKE
jgi:hypothetical protein